MKHREIDTWYHCIQHNSSQTSSHPLPLHWHVHDPVIAPGHTTVPTCENLLNFGAVLLFKVYTPVQEDVDICSGVGGSHRREASLREAAGHTGSSAFLSLPKFS